MVGMVVGNEDGFELEALGLEARHHRRGFAGIHHSSPVAAAQQPDVVILERGNKIDF